MQNKRPQESDLVTKTKYCNDSKTKGEHGVCASNLTQLHFLLNHFSKQNALQKYFMKGDDGIYISHPTSCFAYRKESNISLFSAGIESTASHTAGQTCTNSAALYLAELLTPSCNQTHISSSIMAAIKHF